MADNINSGLGYLIGGFIVILVGVILLQSIADSVSTLSDTYTATNETITPSAGIAQLSGTQTVVLSAISNGSFDWSGAIGTGFNATSDGAVTVNGSFPNAAPVNVTYSYTNENYITDGSSKTLVNLTILFFALAVLLIGVGVGYKGLKDLNIM